MSVSRPPADRLAFKAYEIEELADVYFFRPLGMVFARAARTLGLTPTAVTFVGSLVGIVGGGLLYNPALGLAAFALIILHGVLDSADGQLARMTGQVSDLGRVLDGVGGYITHIAIYVAVIASLVRADAAGPSLAALVVVAAASNIVQAQMYDYHRAIYAAIAIKGFVPAVAAHRVSGWYEAAERRIAGAHPDVERAVAARAVGGVVRDDDRARYRDCFYATVRGWNVCGDNTRFYAIGVLAWLHRLDWFFMFVAVPMNIAFALLWIWQARADRRFLKGL